MEWINFSWGRTRLPVTNILFVPSSRLRSLAGTSVCPFPPFGRRSLRFDERRRAPRERVEFVMHVLAAQCAREQVLVARDLRVEAHVAVAYAVHGVVDAQVMHVRVAVDERMLPPLAAHRGARYDGEAVDDVPSVVVEFP